MKMLDTSRSHHELDRAPWKVTLFTAYVALGAAMVLAQLFGTLEPFAAAGLGLFPFFLVPLTFFRLGRIPFVRLRWAVVGLLILQGIVGVLSGLVLKQGPYDLAVAVACVAWLGIWLSPTKPSPSATPIPLP